MNLLTENSLPRLTVVVLTWNEEKNIGACLASLAAQGTNGFEVVVVDAASTDRTADIVRAAGPEFPVPLRLDVASTRISVGAARNRGAALARANSIAFLSADTEADPRWVAEALETLRSADLAFGRQLHAPPKAGVGAAVRGLRFHFPGGPTSDPARFASHVSAAVRREVIRAFPHGTDAAASAVDDLLLAKRALEAGYHAAYNPAMVVRHRDVDSARAELRKNWREGLGWGSHAAELGLHNLALAWGLLLGFTTLLAALSPGLQTLLLLGAVLWLPAVRRAVQRRRDMPPGLLALGVLASPPFDVAFLLAYARGLVERGLPDLARRSSKPEGAP